MFIKWELENGEEKDNGRCSCGGGVESGILRSGKTELNEMDVGRGSKKLSETALEIQKKNEVADASGKPASRN
jgi:hypothetical protein